MADWLGGHYKQPGAKVEAIPKTPENLLEKKGSLDSIANFQTLFKTASETQANRPKEIVDTILKALAAAAKEKGFLSPSEKSYDKGWHLMVGRAEQGYLVVFPYETSETKDSDLLKALSEGTAVVRIMKRAEQPSGQYEPVVLEINKPGGNFDLQYALPKNAEDPKKWESVMDQLRKRYGERDVGSEAKDKTKQIFDWFAKNMPVETGREKIAA